MKSDIQLKLIAGNANRPLAEAIARRMTVYRGAPVHLVKARVERFKDREIFVEVFENVRDEDMFLIQPTSRPANDNLMELLIMADALRRSSAQRITAVMPYFGYARQDRRTAARTPISAKLVANLITQAGIHRVLTVDLHAGQIQGFFDIPVDNLYSAPVFALDIRHNFPDPAELTVVSPDVGGVQRARELAKRIGAGLAIVDKRRSRPGEIESVTMIGEVRDRVCLIVDDICDTAGTLTEAAGLLMENGAAEVHAYITHGVLSDPALERISASVLKSLVITDSIEQPEAVRASDKIRTVPLAPLLAQAILNISNGASVSMLFSEETLGPIYEAYYPSPSR
ncbi:MAG: ribose-phosphate pyrophosphokinase [Alphaproteobacteria bacterium]|nr:MAG: ribose-phosphate pyrophosphokinase [Alphaproteobacteria bacterium]